VEHDGRYCQDHRDRETKKHFLHSSSFIQS
jgi:hypothetical protein